MTGRGRYRADVDGLRAVAVGAVLMYHAFPLRLPGGFIGVDIFFVISGYLISGIILDAAAEGHFSLAGFYARRIRRIFPALAIVLAAVLGAGWFLLYADDYASVGAHAGAGAAFAANLLQWRESSYFDTAADLKPLLHLWSLGIEEQFYVVWPLMLAWSTRWRRGPLVVVAVIGTVSFAWSIYTVRVDRTAAFFAPWTRFWELLAGAALAAMERDLVLGTWMQTPHLSGRVRSLITTVGLVAIGAGLMLIDGTRVFPGLWALLPVIGTVCVLAAGSDAGVNRAVLGHPWLVWVGLISYPLYLWHWPLLSMARIVSAGPVGPGVRSGLLALSFVLAAATYYTVERPIRFRLRRAGVVVALALVMVAIAATGVTIASVGGLLDRPVNRGDAARLVDYYERLRKSGLETSYRRECDFMEWGTERTLDAIDASCTVAGASGTVLLWGDSYAQAMSQGIRENLPPGVALAQVATSACAPQVRDFDLTVRDRRCETANLAAMAAITRLKPRVVILAQAAGHAGTDWAGLAARVRELGAARVVVVGPLPEWRPALPRIYGEHHMTDRADYVGEGLVRDHFAVDREVRQRTSGLPGVTYVSMLDALCRGGSECLARIPGDDALDLMAIDFGHLSPRGSAYVGRTVWRPMLKDLFGAVIDF